MEMKLLAFLISLCLMCSEVSKLFSKSYTPFCILSSNLYEFQIPYTFHKPCLCGVFERIYATGYGIVQNIIVVHNYIFIITSNTELLFCTYGTLVCLFWTFTDSNFPTLAFLLLIFLFLLKIDASPIQCIPTTISPPSTTSSSPPPLSSDPLLVDLPSEKNRPPREQHNTTKQKQGESPHIKGTKGNQTGGKVSRISKRVKDTASPTVRSSPKHQTNSHTIHTGDWCRLL